jgi:putative transposase
VALLLDRFELGGPPAKPGGRPRTTDMRRRLDGLFYLVRTGCQWRHLPPPPAFPPWPTVYGYMRAFLHDGVWESMRHRFVVMLRESKGREPSPTAAIIDTQSVKTTERRPSGLGCRQEGARAQAPHGGGHAGAAAGRGRARRSIQDADGAGKLLRRLKLLYCRLQTVFADSIYNYVSALLAGFLLGLTLVVVSCIPGTKGFVVLPRRWVVERSIGWLGRWRRLSKDYEALPEVSEAMVTLAMIRLMLHHLAHPNRKRLSAP